MVAREAGGAPVDVSLLNSTGLRRIGVGGWVDALWAPHTLPHLASARAAWLGTWDLGK